MEHAEEGWTMAMYNMVIKSLIGDMAILPVIGYRGSRTFLSLCVIRAGFIDISEI
jgi:hypothetical protein